MQALQTAKAHWVNRDTIGWMGAEPSGTYRLYSCLPDDIPPETFPAALSGLFVPLAVDQDGLSRAVLKKLPFLRGATALRLPPPDLSQVPALLKGGLGA